MTKLAVGMTPEQVEARRQGIGGSDAAAVLGCDPYKTALDVYRVKVGDVAPIGANAAMKRGIYLEPIARRLYRELTGRRVRRLAQRVHPDRPWMIANVDGQIVGDARGPGILEIKCPGVWSFSKIEREGLPLPYLVQANHYMSVFGYGWASFAIFNADLWRLIHFDIARDDELLAALLVAEEQFWKGHVAARVPPQEQQDTTGEVAAALAKAEGAAPGGTLIVRSDAEWAEAARAYIEAHELAETADNLKSTATEKLKALVGGQGAVEGAGLRCYLKQQDGRRTLDRKALEKAHPEIDLSQYEKVGKPFEVFKVYPVAAGVGD